jgi:hypothetical protein
VFQPNYRGSDNLGNEYMAAIIGDAGAGLDGTSCRSRDAAETILRRSQAHGGHRLVYGGYMTSWLISNYPRNGRPRWPGTRHQLGRPVQLWRRQYPGPLPVRRLALGDGRIQAYRDQSPITYATKIKTPTSSCPTWKTSGSADPGLHAVSRHEGQWSGDRVHRVQRKDPRLADPVNSRERARLWVDWVKRHLNGRRLRRRKSASATSFRTRHRLIGNPRISHRQA